MIRGTIMSGRADISTCIDIRRKVFVDEQGFSPCGEPDVTDPVALHALLFDDGVPAATGRLYDTDGVFHAGRFAVLKEYRGRGLGELVVRMLVNKAFELDAGEVHVGAQDQAVGFYERIGFKTCGEAYMDEHVLHYPMVITPKEFAGHCAE